MLDFHYTSGIILFYSSFLGCILPFQRKIDLTPIRPLSTGIVFGVALCHLLPDSSQILDTVQVTEWFARVTGLHGGDVYDTLPVSETLMCLGIFIMLVIDQFCPCHHIHQPMGSLSGCESNEKQRLMSSVGGCSEYGSNDICSKIQQTSVIEAKIEAGISITPLATETNITLSHHQQQASMPYSKIYATETAIAIHSIIIGFTIGINPDTSALLGLTIALIFHQVFEGMALAMIAVQGNLGFYACCVLVAMFSLSLPCGILLGLLVYHFSSPSSTDDELDMSAIFFQGVPNAIAAGMLIHIGFELMMKDFNHLDRHENNSKFPTLKLALVFFGGATICFLAIWA